jgi:Sigma-70 factor, region 1.2
MRTFLKHIDDITPLSAEEEVELAKRIESGRRAHCGLDSECRARSGAG